MLNDERLERIVQEKAGGCLQFRQKVCIQESHRSSVYRCIFSDGNAEDCTFILKVYTESTHEALLYAYLHTRRYLDGVLLDCGEENDRPYILMHDLAKTHQSLCDWQPPISQEQQGRLLMQIAHFHTANRADYADLRRQIGLPWHLQSVKQYREHLGYLRRDFDRFQEHPPFLLSPDQLQCYEEALNFLEKDTPFLFEHLHQNDIFTFIHGDLNVGNVYYPLAPEGAVVFLDYEAIRVGLFGEDLVMLLVHDLYHGAEETRRMFGRYYQCLPDGIRQRLTPALFEHCTRHVLSEGLFFPMKLFAHYGVNDEALVRKSLDAFEQLVH